MAVVFVHGVNVRRSAEYDTSVATRDEMIRQHLLKPLLLLSHDIMNPYWGDCGVSFAWNQDTVPQVSEKKSILEGQGVSDAYLQLAKDDLPVFIELHLLSLSDVANQFKN